MNLNRLVASILLAVVLMLLPSYIFEGQSQTAAHPAASTQCIDFDQDKTCEYIMLANGTMISNPLQAAQPATGTTSRTTQTANFLPYENPTLGIRIQHPVGWQLEEDDNKVTFVQQKDIVSLEANVDNNIDSSLADYVNTRLQELREQRQNFNLVESTPTTISGNPAHKLVYTFLKEDGPRAGEINKVLRIWTIKDNKLYTLAYLSEADRYSEHLPEIEKTIDSYKINSVTTPASARSTDSNNDNKNNERNNDNNQKNWRKDPNCWYYEYFVCDESGKCDSENFDCVTDCDDGSSVTTGFPCPGEKDEGVPGESDGSGGDPDSRRPPSDNPYCDVVDKTGKSYETCHDRRDYSDTTGLYTCSDGSEVEDYKDCKVEAGGPEDLPECDGSYQDCATEDGYFCEAGSGAHECEVEEENDNDDADESKCFENNDGSLGDPVPCEDNDDDSGGSNPDGEEDDQSCGGESCSDDEKEDSTTDEDGGELFG